MESEQPYVALYACHRIEWDGDPYAPWNVEELEYIDVKLFIDDDQQEWVEINQSSDMAEILALVRKNVSSPHWYARLIRVDLTEKEALYFKMRWC